MRWWRGTLQLLAQHTTRQRIADAADDVGSAAQCLIFDDAVRERRHECTLRVRGAADADDCGWSRARRILRGEPVDH